MRWMAALAMLVIASVAWPERAEAQAERRVALILANSAYTAVPPLPNPARDGALVAESLRRAGFAAVEVSNDLSKAETDAALRAFKRMADTADVAVIYFAGHGIEIDQQNWLLPADAKLEDPTDVYTEAISLDVLLRHVSGARQLRIVMLDACRENPFAMRFASTRSIARGLRPVEGLPRGTVVAFAAAGGQLSADGAEGGNSPFAQALARRLVQPGVELNLMLRQVRDDVMAANPGGQEPWVSASLSSEPFYFVPGRGGEAARPQASAGGARAGRNAVDAETLDALAWQGAVTANTASAYRLYLQQHPNGRFAELARENERNLSATVAVSRGGSTRTPAPQRPPMPLCDAMKAIAAEFPTLAGVMGPPAAYLDNVFISAVQTPEFEECQVNGFSSAYADCSREYADAGARDAAYGDLIAQTQRCFASSQYSRERRYVDDDGDMNYILSLQEGVSFRLLKYKAENRVVLFISPR